jgi:hypothetical protein
MKPFRRLMLACAVLLPISAHAAFSAEHLYFPYCVNNICKVDDTSPLVRLSPKELAQMRELSDRVYDILVHAWDNTDQTNITTKELK